MKYRAEESDDRKLVYHDPAHPIAGIGTLSAGLAVLAFGFVREYYVVACIFGLTTVFRGITWFKSRRLVFDSSTRDVVFERCFLNWERSASTPFSEFSSIGWVTESESSGGGPNASMVAVYPVRLTTTKTSIEVSKDRTGRRLGRSSGRSVSSPGLTRGMRTLPSWSSVRRRRKPWPRRQALAAR